jgi:DNA-binding NarL/FixJ family response regulator
MRVVLVGPADARRRLRSALAGVVVEIAGEAETMAEARALGVSAEAFVVSQEAHARVGQREERSSGAFDEPLTPRELDVLRLLAEGLSNKGIAERLAISDQTVKFHVAAIYGKLGAANRADAVRRAVRRGLIAV